MEALLAFGAALLALRMAGLLARRRRWAWAGALFSYAVASAALAWGAAHGWDARAFRVYYLAGGLLTAPLLGAGSLLLYGWRRAGAVALAYTGLAAGIAISVPVHGAWNGDIPAAQDHLAFLPARLVAVLANSVGTLAVLAVAVVTFRRRPLGNALIVAGVVVAGLGSALAGLGEAGTAAFSAAAVLLLYAGVVSPRLRRRADARTTSGSAAAPHASPR